MRYKEGRGRRKAEKTSSSLYSITMLLLDESESFAGKWHHLPVPEGSLVERVNP